MLSPRRVRHRKQMKQVRHIKGVATRGNTVNFGDYGLMALEGEWITNRQIEASRVALNRHMKRGGRVWIRVFPDKPLTKKPAEVRMGKGKGSPESWVAEVQAGRIIFEIKGVEDDVAREAMRLAAAKLPIRTKVVERRKNVIL